MKKGFTLIELLAVIVILAIILVVAVPRIMKAVDSSKVNAYISNEKLVLKSAELYVSKNIESLPANIGDTTEILLSSLITDGYIKDIKSPYNKNNSCSGYVLITKKNSDEYDYTPHINCFDNTIVSSTQDKLLLHYKFDDFQEPTINLADTIDPVLNPWGTPPMTGTSTYFDSPSGSQGIYANLIFNGDGGYLWRFTNNNVPITVLPSTQYTVSAIIKWAGPSNPSPNLFYLRQYRSDNSQVSEEGLYNSSYLEDMGNGYFKAYRTFTTNVGTAKIVMQSYQYSTIEIWMYDFQIEKKSYKTPFVQGERTGIVNDYSANNNHSTLTLANTPKWVFDGGRSEGVYKFNGNSNYIRTNAKITSKSFTISAWINVFNYNTLESWIVEQYADSLSPGRTILSLTNDGTLRMFMNSLPVYGPIIQKNKWYHVVGGRKEDGTGFLYTNGILSATGNLSTVDIYDVPISIGARVNDNMNYFDGLMDDIRIYNRALTEDEIKLLYESTK